MSTPSRIQLRRTRGWRKPDNTVVVSRPSRWGNPHPVGWCGICGGEHSREEACAKFRADIDNQQELRGRIMRELRGRNLACWCPLPQAGKPDVCHAAVLLEIANR